MKILIQNNRISGTATDAYMGPDEFISAPENFDASLIDKYAIVAGELKLIPPEQVTMRQARLALLSVGLLSSVNDAISSLPSPQKEAAQIEWEYAAVVQRSSGLVPTMGAALGMTETQLNDLFFLAETL
jgi:hypothetical protein